MNRGQGAAAGASDALSLLGGRQNAADTYNHDITARELLLELTDKALLDLVEGLEQAVRDVNEDGLAGSGNVDLLGGSDEEVAEVGFELSVGSLKIEESLQQGVWREGWGG